MTEPSGEEERLELPMALTGLNDVPIVFVNWAAVTHQGSEFVLTLGQFTEPILLGSPDQRREQARRVGAVPIKVVGRFGLTHQRMMELVRTLSENVQRYETKKGLRDG